MENQIDQLVSSPLPDSLTARLSDKLLSVTDVHLMLSLWWYPCCTLHMKKKTDKWHCLWHVSASCSLHTGSELWYCVGVWCNKWHSWTACVAAWCLVKAEWIQSHVCWIRVFRFSHCRWQHQGMFCWTLQQYAEITSYLLWGNVATIQ